MKLRSGDGWQNDGCRANLVIGARPGRVGAIYRGDR